MMSRWIAGGFGALLVLAGVLGFVQPAGKGATSSAPAYNTFHLVFGALGLAAAVWGAGAARTFLVGFGLLDLYQALASHQHWFPESLFRWTRTDDLIHMVVGVALVAAGTLL